jgi:hypothetical protein
MKPEEVLAQLLAQRSTIAALNPTEIASQNHDFILRRTYETCNPMISR